MYDAVALGELLIDFTYAGKSLDGMRLFEQNPGGAPGNFLTVLAKMGLKTSMIGKVGCDMHGDFLIETLRQNKVGVEGVVSDGNFFTTLAFVDISENGERHFSFSRKPGADTRIDIAEIDKELLLNTKLFHIGSLSLTDEPAKSATHSSVDLAKSSGAIISFDPNYRASLWNTKDDAVSAIMEMLPKADILKVSDEEATLLTGESDYNLAADKLLQAGPKIVAVTLGKDGVLVKKESEHAIVPGFEVEAVDTTGAGDSFWGGFVGSLIASGKSIGELTLEDLSEFARYGNATASICVQRRGGIPAIPDSDEVRSVLKS